MMVIDARGQTFGMTSARDMLRKLEYERQQAVESIGKPEERFIAINLASTAFHTLDWIAADLIDRDIWNQAQAALGIRTDGESFDQRVNGFKTYATMDCKFLRICRHVANASKHRNLRRYDQAIEAHQGSFERAYAAPDLEKDFVVTTEHHVTYFSLREDDFHGAYGVNQIAHEVATWMVNFVDRWMPEK